MRCWCCHPNGRSPHLPLDDAVVHHHLGGAAEGNVVVDSRSIAARVEGVAPQDHIAQGRAATPPFDGEPRATCAICVLEECRCLERGDVWCGHVARCSSATAVITNDTHRVPARPCGRRRRGAPPSSPVGASARRAAQVPNGNPADHDRHADKAKIRQCRKRNRHCYNPTPPGPGRGPGIGPRGSGEWNRTTDLQRVKLASCHCSTPRIQSDATHSAVQARGDDPSVVRPRRSRRPRAERSCADESPTRTVSATAGRRWRRWCRWCPRPWIHSQIHALGASAGGAEPVIRAVVEGRPCSEARADGPPRTLLARCDEGCATSGVAARRALRRVARAGSARVPREAVVAICARLALDASFE